MSSAVDLHLFPFAWQVISQDGPARVCSGQRYRKNDDSLKEFRKRRIYHFLHLLKEFVPFMLGSAFIFEFPQLKFEKFNLLKQNGFLCLALLT
jgi:hypothetical protein